MRRSATYFADSLARDEFATLAAKEPKWNFAPEIPALAFWSALFARGCVSLGFGESSGDRDSRQRLGGLMVLAGNCLRYFLLP